MVKPTEKFCSNKLPDRALINKRPNMIRRFNKPAESEQPVSTSDEEWKNFVGETRYYGHSNNPDLEVSKHVTVVSMKNGIFRTIVGKIQNKNHMWVLSESLPKEKRIIYPLKITDKEGKFYSGVKLEDTGILKHGIEILRQRLDDSLFFGKFDEAHGQAYESTRSAVVGSCGNVHDEKSRTETDDEIIALENNPQYKQLFEGDYAPNRHTRREAPAPPSEQVNKRPKVSYADL